MELKVIAVLGLTLCLFGCAYSATIKKTVQCTKLVTTDITDEECDDGTGKATQTDAPDNNFVGYDSKGRRVMKIGDNGTCLIDPNPEALPSYVSEAEMSINKTEVLVTDEDVLESVRQWCEGDVYELVPMKPKSDLDRKKRAILCYYRCRYYIIWGRLWRYCRRICIIY